MRGLSSLSRGRAPAGLGLPGYGPAALPIMMRRPGSDGAVLLIHGYTGYPGELGYLAEALFRAGHSVCVPRLPGHGTDRADFMATGAADWIGRARDAYIELAAEYGRVRVAGHSMGGAIAAILAAEFAPDSAALLAPALELADRRIRFARLVGRFVPVVRTGAAPSPEDAEGERRRLHEEYRSDLLLRQAGELYRVVKAARKALPLIRSRILVVSGELDAAVKASAATYAASEATRAASFKAETILSAGHLFPFLPEGRDACADLVEEWFAT